MLLVHKSTVQTGSGDFPGSLFSVVYLPLDVFYSVLPLYVLVYCSLCSLYQFSFSLILNQFCAVN